MRPIEWEPRTIPPASRSLVQIRAHAVPRGAEPSTEAPIPTSCRIHTDTETDTVCASDLESPAGELWEPDAILGRDEVRLVGRVVMAKMTGRSCAAGDPEVVSSS